MWGKLDKKFLIYLGIVLTTAIIVGGSLIYYFSRSTIEAPTTEEKPAKKSIEEIIKSLTAPARKTELISEELRESISASSKETNTKTLEDILKSLTAPE